MVVGKEGTLSLVLKNIIPVENTTLLKHLKKAEKQREQSEYIERERERRQRGLYSEREV